MDKVTARMKTHLLKTMGLSMGMGGFLCSCLPMQTSEAPQHAERREVSLPSEPEIYAALYDCRTRTTAQGETHIMTMDEQPDVPRGTRLALTQLTYQVVPMCHGGKICQLFATFKALDSGISFEEGAAFPWPSSGMKDEQSIYRQFQLSIAPDFVRLAASARSHAVMPGAATVNPKPASAR